MMKTAVVMGASSGMGLEIARILLAKGWRVGVAARRAEPLRELCSQWPECAHAAIIDIDSDSAQERLLGLFGELGGAIDLYVHTAGIGKTNMELEPRTELATVETNGLGFTRMVTAAFNHMATHGGGHIAAITSIAGTKGLGAAPAYSATKAFQNCYLQALEQQSAMRKLGITFTDVRPGFVDTALLGGDHYPMLMDCKTTAAGIVNAILAHRHVCVIDWRWRLLTALWRRVPRWLWRRLPVHQ